MNPEPKKQTYNSRYKGQQEGTVDTDSMIVKKKARSTTSKIWKTLYSCLAIEDLPRAFWQSDDLTATLQSKGVVVAKEAWLPSCKFSGKKYKQELISYQWQSLIPLL